MVSISIEIGLYLAVPLALLGAASIYRDATQRRMETADMWAVGFVVGFFLLPVLGGIVVLAVYLRKRNRRRGRPDAVPGY